MKKRIVVMLLVLLPLLSIYAGYEWTGTTTDGNASMTINLSDTSGFTDTSEVEHGFVVFGFTNSNAVETVISTTDSLVLSETFVGDGNATASGLIYGFVRVASRTKMKFSLNWESFNKETTSSIDLTVDGEGQLSSSDQEQNQIALTVNGNGSGYIFYTFDPATDVMVDERIPLFISTAKYTNNSVDGSFSTVINMKVESVI